ncbi:MAG: O-antigen ligase family protein [bacterium]
MKMRSNLKYFFIGLLIILPSIFDCEKFLFIRYYSLIGSFALAMLFALESKKRINIPAFAVLLIYTVSFVIHYNFSVNGYNARLHFAEYGFYFLILLYVSSAKWDKGKLFITISHAVIVSGIVQIIYSLDDFAGRAGRIEGNTHYPNFLSLLFIAGVVSSAFLIIRYFSQGRKLRGLVYGLTGILLLYADFRTGSRNIIVLLPLAAFLIIFAYKKRMAVIGLTAAVLLMLLIPSNAQHRFFHEREINPYGVQRANIYKQTAGIALRNLPMGIGYNNLSYYTLKNNFPVEGRIARFGSHAKIAHNEYLEWFVSAGIFGLAIMLVFLYAFIGFIRRSNLKLPGKFILIILSLFFIMSVFDNALYLPYNAVVFFICMGALFRHFKANPGLLYKITVIIVFAILVITNAIDIYAHYKTKPINETLSSSEDITDENYEYITEKVLTLYALTGKPQYIESHIIVSEQLFKNTNSVKYFQNILDDYGMLLSSFPMEYRYYLTYSDFLMKYKNTVLRKNNSINEMIELNYQKGIDLNPRNPFYRYAFARYHLEQGDTAGAVSHLEKAIEYEPYFIRGIMLLNSLSDNPQLMQRQYEIMDSLPELLGKAKTQYEYKLLEYGENSVN